MEAEITMRSTTSAHDLDLLEPLWGALQAHHAEVLPTLGDRTPPRSHAESWVRRREKYEGWLSDEETFILLAEGPDGPVGYAFVTVGAGYAGWRTGRIAELQTLSVLPQCRGEDIGGRLLDGVWTRLEEQGVDEMAITTAVANVDSQRFYERHGFQPAFLLYYGKREGSEG
jgi:ribosomal protein S18 acetylase RimI-like enzyme